MSEIAFCPQQLFAAVLCFLFVFHNNCVANVSLKEHMNDFRPIIFIRFFYVEARILIVSAVSHRLVYLRAILILSTLNCNTL